MEIDGIALFVLAVRSHDARRPLLCACVNKHESSRHKLGYNQLDQQRVHVTGGAPTRSPSGPRPEGRLVSSLGIGTGQHKANIS